MGEWNNHFRTAYRAFYAEHRNTANLLDAIDSICSVRIPVHGTIFGLSLKQKELSELLQTGRRRVRGFTVSGRDFLKVEVTPDSGTDLFHRGSAAGYLIFNPRDYVACLLGLVPDFDYLFGELKRYLHTWITPLFLRTQEFRQTLVPLSHVVEVRGYTANVLWDDGQRVKTRREWFPAAKPVQEFFIELEQERQWLRSLELVFHTKDRSGSGRIRRDLSFSCQDGFSVFWNMVLDAVKSNAGANRCLFQDRAVSSSPTHAARPLQIAYTSGIFDDKKQNHRLIKVLRGLSDSGLSVFHPNPFLHAALMDYSDGSTYTIWVTDSSAIKIIPGLKASPRSLGRLCNHINEHFEEGSVEEIAI
jgi:hypothetical protein